MLKQSKATKLSNNFWLERREYTICYSFFPSCVCVCSSVVLDERYVKSQASIKFEYWQQHDGHDVYLVVFVWLFRCHSTNRCMSQWLKKCFCSFFCIVRHCSSLDCLSVWCVCISHCNLNFVCCVYTHFFTLFLSQSNVCSSHCFHDDNEIYATDMLAQPELVLHSVIHMQICFACFSPFRFSFDLPQKSSCCHLQPRSHLDTLNLCNWFK